MLQINFVEMEEISNLFHVYFYMINHFSENGSTKFISWIKNKQLKMQVINCYDLLEVYMEELYLFTEYHGKEANYQITTWNLL
jgi:hypothetical protein